MKLHSRTARILGGAAAAVALLAASWVPLAVDEGAFDPAQFRANLAHWQELPEAQRDVMRERWVDFQTRPVEEQELFAQRMDVVRRMTATMRRILGRDPTFEELAERLAEVRDAAKLWLERTTDLSEDATDDEQRAAMAQELAVRIGSFLDLLVAVEQLDTQARSALKTAPSSLLVRDALSLHAAEQRRRAEEGGEAAPAGSAPTARDVQREGLRQIDRDAVQTVRREAEEPAPADDNATSPRRRAQKLRFVRSLLEERGVPSREIEELYSLPEGELVITLEALLRR